MNKLRLGPILLFVLLSYGFAWLVALPLWLDRGLNNPLFLLLSVLMMGTPALAALITSKLTEPTLGLATSLGLSPWKPISRLLMYAGLAILLSVSVHLMALVVGSLFGVFHFDLRNFSAFDELLRSKLAGHEDVLAKLPPLWLLVIAQALAILPGSVLNAIPALGEELGWRGWLLPKLMPLGTFPAIVISGVIWALWHAPVILLGYNYPTVSVWVGMSCMIAMCVCVGALLAWLRLRSASVWPVAVAHGAFNGAAGFYLLIGKSGYAVNTSEATALGWTGWLFPALLAWVLFKFWKPAQGTSVSAIDGTQTP